VLSVYRVGAIRGGSEPGLLAIERLSGSDLGGGVASHNALDQVNSHQGNRRELEDDSFEMNCW